MRERAVVIVVGFVVALAIAATVVVHGAPPALGHCGCMASRPDGCTEPCSSCCGPGGYADCFKNPGPTVAATRSSSCCGKGH